MKKIVLFITLVSGINMFGAGAGVETKTAASEKSLASLAATPRLAVKALQDLATRLDWAGRPRFFLTELAEYIATGQIQPILKEQFEAALVALFGQHETARILKEAESSSAYAALMPFYTALYGEFKNQGILAPNTPTPEEVENIAKYRPEDDKFGAIRNIIEGGRQS